MAQALFARIEVEGAREATVYLTPEAESPGLLAAVGAEPIWCSIDRSGRGERVSADTKYRSLLIPVANVPSHVYRSEDTA